MLREDKKNKDKIKKNIQDIVLFFSSHLRSINCDLDK